MEHVMLGLCAPACCCDWTFKTVPRELSCIFDFWGMARLEVVLSSEGSLPARVWRAPLVTSAWENEGQPREEPPRGLSENDGKLNLRATASICQAQCREAKVSTDSKWKESALDVSFLSDCTSQNQDLAQIPWHGGEHLCPAGRQPEQRGSHQDRNTSLVWVVGHRQFLSAVNALQPEQWTRR